jgi:hypothetical protein
MKQSFSSKAKKWTPKSVWRIRLPLEHEHSAKGAGLHGSEAQRVRPQAVIEQKYKLVDVNDAEAVIETPKGEKIR